MTEKTNPGNFTRNRLGSMVHAAWAGPALFGLALGAVSLAPGLLGSPLIAQSKAMRLPALPANGELGFVVESFHPAIVEGKEACPQGPALNLRASALESLTPDERIRLERPENQDEYNRRWQDVGFARDGSNMCSQPDRFDRPLLRMVQSKQAIGLDLDGGDAGPGCAHQEFVSPQGERGIDNQAYRALGCTIGWRRPDGGVSDMPRGFRQFLASGEWTQVILLRGIDSLENDPEVQVIYGNTPDRPVVDSKGEFLPGASFTISTKPPRHRNELKGRIVAGVLTTELKDIKLTQTWGQGGARDIRGNRTTFDLRRSRLKLTFHPDGSLKGIVGGYQPVFELIQSISFGGAGAITDGAFDCAGSLKTLKALADGVRDPETGQCTAVSTAYEVDAVPAFVVDAPDQRTVAK